MALQRQKVVVAKTDGTVERYPITPKVQTIFERNRHTGLTTGFIGEGAATNMYWLAWEAERALDNGHITVEFETWLETVEAVDMEVEEIVPFGKGAKATGSPKSLPPPG